MLGSEMGVPEEVALNIVPKNINDQLEADPSVDLLITDVRFNSETSIEYVLPESAGYELKPGHSLAFVIPKHLRRRLVRDVILRHRKGEKYRQGTKTHDTAGAYSRVELLDEDSQQWKGWKDPKGYSPDKFAEWRSESDPENEVLHDWLAMVGEVKPEVVRVKNVGQNKDFSVSQIHGVEVIFFPELEGVSYREQIYTPGTEFIDIEQKKLLPRYGGGSHTEGIYQNAVALNNNSSINLELNTEPGNEVKVEGSRMVIDLEPGKKLVQVEIAVGDSEHQNQINPKTGKHTRLGWAKLWVGIERAETGQVDWFIHQANVPPQGVIAGGPKIENASIQDGDKLIIQSQQDTSYIMGWRIAYKEPDNLQTNQQIETSESV